MHLLLPIAWFLIISTSGSALSMDKKTSRRTSTRIKKEPGRLTDFVREDDSAVKKEKGPKKRHRTRNSRRIIPGSIALPHDCTPIEDMRDFPSEKRQKIQISHQGTAAPSYYPDSVVPLKRILPSSYFLIVNTQPKEEFWVYCFFHKTGCQSEFLGDCSSVKPDRGSYIYKESSILNAMFEHIKTSHNDLIKDDNKTMKTLVNKFIGLYALRTHV